MTKISIIALAALTLLLGAALLWQRSRLQELRREVLSVVECECVKDYKMQVDR